VYIDLTTPPVIYKPNVVVAFTNKWVIDNFTSKYLDANKIFVFGFDFTDLEDLDFIEDWGEVVQNFPDSNRVVDKKMWFGDIENKLQAIEEYLSHHLVNYQIINLERHRWLQ